MKTVKAFLSDTRRNLLSAERTLLPYMNKPIDRLPEVVRNALVGVNLDSKWLAEFSEAVARLAQEAKESSK
jgi:hypothetical protein